MIYEYDEPFCPLGMTGSLESLPPATLVELGLGLGNLANGGGCAAQRQPQRMWHQGLRGKERVWHLPNMLPIDGMKFH
jgi:hypothetical protein